MNKIRTRIRIKPETAPARDDITGGRFLRLTLFEGSEDYYGELSDANGFGNIDFIPENNEDLDRFLENAVPRLKYYLSSNKDESTVPELASHEQYVGEVIRNGGV